MPDLKFEIEIKIEIEMKIKMKLKIFSDWIVDYFGIEYFLGGNYYN